VRVSCGGHHGYAKDQSEDRTKNNQNNSISSFGFHAHLCVDGWEKGAGKVRKKRKKEGDNRVRYCKLLCVCVHRCGVLSFRSIQGYVYLETHKFLRSCF
jgi:hypothetical protein